MNATALRFLLWSLREHLVKKILAWQASHPDSAYRLWRKYDSQSNPSLSSPNPVLPVEGAVNEPFASFVVVIDRENQRPALETTLNSIINQGLQKWEALVFVCNQVHEAESVWNSSNDPRVRFCSYTEDQKALHFLRAVEAARGRFICWLEAGGVLVPQALEAVATLWSQNPDIKIIYYDLDVISPDGSRLVKPFFKPGWSPELLLSVNYLGGSFFQKEFITQRVLLPENLPTSEWDLALRCIDQVDNVVHLPNVIYHHPSVALRKANESETETRSALIAHLKRKGFPNPSVRFTESGHPKLQWELSKHTVSIIIPTKDNLVYLKRCIESIRSYSYPYEYEIVLIDTGSHDPAVRAYYQTLQTLPNLTLTFDDAPFNFNRINNLGARYASGDLLLFLNNDIEAQDPGWLDELVRWMEYPGVGIVGAKLLYPDGAIQHAGIIMGMEGHCSHVFGGTRQEVENPFGSIDWYRNYLAVTGACLMTSRQVFDQIGGFDEAYRLVFSDVEFCFRAVQNGYRVMYTPYCKLIHYEGRSRGHSIPPADIQLGYHHFKEQVRIGDPYYHPALSYSGRLPVFAWPFETPREARLEKIYQFSKTRRP